MRPVVLQGLVSKLCLSSCALAHIRMSDQTPRNALMGVVRHTSSAIDCIGRTPDLFVALQAGRCQSKPGRPWQYRPTLCARSTSHLRCSRSFPAVAWAVCRHLVSGGPAAAVAAAVNDATHTVIPLLMCRARGVSYAAGAEGSEGGSVPRRSR